MKTFQYVSPSQISTFRSCNRQWYFQSILGIRAPQKPSAALGEAVHKQLEDYILKGTPPDKTIPAGQIASKGLGFLPPAAECDVELNIGEHPAGQNLKIEGIQVTGRIDLLRWKGAPMPEVLDHKTTSNPSYALTESELHNDPQMLIYSGFLYALLKHQKVWEGRQMVRATHLVYGTRAPYVSQRTSVLMEYDHVRDAWGTHLRDTVLDMKDAAVLPSVIEVEPNYSACGKYGGCFFKDKCQAMKQGGQTEMSLLNIVKGTPSTSSTSTPAPAPAPAKPAPAPAPVAPAASVLPPDAPPRNDKAAAQPSLLGAAKAAVEAEKTYVREERAAIQNESDLRDTPGDLFGPAITAANAPLGDATPAVEEPVVAAPVVEAVEAVDEKPKKTRTKAAPAAEAPAAQPTANTPAPVKAEAPRAGLVLYIDCFPERGRDTEFTLLEDLIKPWAEQICEQEKVPHWSLVPYNRGPAFLCAKALANPPKGILIVQTRQPSAAALLEVLRPMADIIIRGW
jgi:RecB family exonuclease